MRKSVEFLPLKRIEILHYTADAVNFVKTTVNLKNWIWKGQMTENQRVSRIFLLKLKKRQQTSWNLNSVIQLLSTPSRQYIFSQLPRRQLHLIMRGSNQLSGKQSGPREIRMGGFLPLSFGTCFAHQMKRRACLQASNWTYTIAYHTIPYQSNTNKAEWSAT